MNKKINDVIINCKICGNTTFEKSDLKTKVTYDVCPVCDFISIKEHHLLSPQDEQKRYELHNNDTFDSGYTRRFENMIDLHIKPLKQVKNILDFGSGPYPMLSHILKEQGYQVVYFDPYFANNMSYRNQKYDLIVLSEVIEHIQYPLQTLDGLLELLHQDGFILVMTEFRTMDIDGFFTWWYRRDSTHISFFNQKTFETIAKNLQLKIYTTNQKNIILFQK
jgi:2-polyprenyl-3-methyl-5-hydroxy-6-metoxy-1,4-benzoquinol methylase